MTILDFDSTASGAYHATATTGHRFYSVMRLTSRRWVMEMSMGGAPVIREEAQTMRQAMVLAEVRELASQGRTGEALALKATATHGAHRAQNGYPRTHAGTCQDCAAAKAQQDAAEDAYGY